MTTRGKIEEAEYFLSRFEQTPIDVLKYEVSAFLSATRSIFDHMLEEYRVTFILGDIKFLSVNTFEDQATKRNNMKALEFLKWYKDRMSALRNNPDYGFLFEKRDHNVHRDSNKQVTRLTWEGPITIEAKSEVEIPLAIPRNIRTPTQVEGKVTKDNKTETFRTEIIAQVFFEENKDVSMSDLCSALLRDTKTMVEEAEKTWRLQYKA